MRWISILAAALAGCASPVPYWVHTDPKWTTREIVVHNVDIHPYGAHVRGWAHRDKATGTCTIILTRSALDRECVLRHELKHCQGWDHPDYAYAMDCN